MAEKKKKGLTFKEAPIYCKIMRIALAVLMLLAAIQMIVAAVLTSDNPFLWWLYMPAIGFAIPAVVIGIVNLNLEKKYLAKLEAQQSAPEVPKSEEPTTEQPKVEDSWICPKCGATMTGKFCHKCGTKKPEKVAAAAAPVAAKQEPVAVPAEQKKSKKGLIIGLSVGGGVLLLAGLVVGGVFGIKAIANAINGGSASEEIKESLPENYKFDFKGSYAKYQTTDKNTGFQFNSDYSLNYYSWVNTKLSMIKYGTWEYTRSTQTISVTITSYETKPTSGDWFSGNYEEPQYITFEIKTETKMVYYASNINRTVVNKVDGFSYGLAKN